MNIENPLFIIPTKNRKADTKPGGGNPPKYVGDPSKFEKHRRDRVEELDRLMQVVKKTKTPKISSPEGKLFFEIEFHEKAISKSMQPRKLLNANNIDVFSQKSDTKFFASSTEENVRSFRDSVSKISLGTDKNDSAYLSAITGIKPIAREDKLINERYLTDNKKFTGFLYLADTLSVNECKQITTMVRELHQQAEFFITEAGAKTIYGIFPSSFINEISEPDPRIPIQKIEKSITFFFPQSFSFHYPYSEIEISEPTLDAKVGIVDTGIEQHDIYKHLVLGVEDFIGDPRKENRVHGTFVATRAIFGNDIERQIRVDKALSAKAKVVDIKIMKKGEGANDREIILCLQKVLDNPKYSDLKVFNLSLNDDGGVDSIHSNEKTYFTRELDALSHKHKVIFVVSAGNHNAYFETGKKYPDCLLVRQSVITPPADLINGVSVGAIADTDSSRSVSLNNEPSPFTRTGIVGVTKPDLVHFGGNWDEFASPAGIGVKGFSITKDQIDEGVGTSYSSPLVSQITAQIYAFVNQSQQWTSPPIDLSKALLIHSAAYDLPLNSKIPQDELYRIIGFGIPDFNRAIDCVKSSATFIYCDAIGNVTKNGDDEIKEAKHKIKFVVPSELVGKGKQIRVKGTLVYTPMVSASGEMDYSLVDIEVNLHRLNSKGTMGSAGLTKNTKDYRVKWNPIKHFEGMFNAYSGGEWEVWLTLTTRGALDGKPHTQDYALVLTLDDATADSSKRINLHEIIRSQHKEYNLLELRAKARVR